MNLTESKSSLARLLATEDLLIEERAGAKTAFFDTQSRLLVVPKLREDLTSDVLDLMLSHEVSHSLNTPVDWSDSCKLKQLNRSITNVVEDSRIERLIKNKYPGLRSVYYRAYKELMSIDFFGLSKIDDVSELNLVDKINLHCKVGFLSFIEFTPEEQALLDKVESTETFDDVISVSLEIQEYIKKNLEKEYEENPLTFDVGDDFDYDQEESVETESIENELGKPKTSDEKDELEENNNSGFDNALPNDFDSEFDSLESSKSLEEFIEENLKSFTQDEAELKKEELYSNSNKVSFYVDIPDIKISDYVQDYKVLYKNLKEYFSSGTATYRNVVFTIDQTQYNKFKIENSTIVSYLIKEFNLKKNAEGRKKTKVSKTGDIHLNKLYSYKISDDIFKRATSVPKAQSHGLVFFLDWSGSMINWMNDTIKQLLVMLMFCRKQNIPFEVYAFSTNGSTQKKFNEKEMILNPVNLFNLFSSRMSNSEFIYASNCLLSFDGHAFKNPGYFKYPPQWFALGNTPLNHSIFLSKEIVKEFQTRTKVQIVNSIYLTDGDSHGIQFITRDYGYDRHVNLDTSMYNIYLRDRKTKETLPIKPRNNIQQTNACVKFTKQISNFRMFAFRLCTPTEVRSNVHTYFGFETDRNAKVREFNRDNCLEVPSEFDKFYFVKGNLLTKEDSFSDDFDSKSVSNMSKEFAKIMSKKVNTRLFLKKFIEFIS